MVTLLLAVVISTFPSLGVYAGARVETPVSICCIGDLYSVDYEFEAWGDIEDVTCSVPDALFSWNYIKNDARLYISFAAASPVKVGIAATVISNGEIFLNPVSVRLNGYLTETKCISHAETAMPEVAPTHDADGSRGGVICARCGYVISEPTVLPATGPQISATLSTGGTLTVSGAMSDCETAENCVLLSVYKDMRLLECMDITAKKQNELNFEIENMQGADKIKIFRWNSLSGMTPMYEATEVEVVK